MLINIGIIVYKLKYGLSKIYFKYILKLYVLYVWIFYLKR